MQVRKTSYNMTTISRKNMVSKLADKWKSTNTIIEFSENNRDREKKRSKKKRVRIN